MSQLSLSLPQAQSSFVRIVAVVTTTGIGAMKVVARAYRFRREARALAGLDRAMLSDIGVSHSDIRDALSQPFWRDPTELLRLRAEERRHRRHRVTDAPSIQPVEQGFYPLPTARAARHIV